MTTELQWTEKIINTQKFGSSAGYAFYYYIQNERVASICMQKGAVIIPSKLCLSFEEAQDYCQSHHDAICKAVEEALIAERKKISKDIRNQFDHIVGQDHIKVCPKCDEYIYDCTCEAL